MNNLIVTGQSGLSMTATAVPTYDGLNLTGYDGTTFTQFGGPLTIAGADDGIDAWNDNRVLGGNLYISSVGGTVNGHTGAGIVAANTGVASGAGGSSVAVYSGDVRGYTQGIDVSNFSTGFGVSDVTVNSTAGDVRSNGDGIRVVQNVGSTGADADVTVRTADVMASAIGVNVFAGGNARAIVDSSAGTVTGATGVSVYNPGVAMAGVATTAITTGAINGVNAGIRAIGLAYSRRGSVNLTITTGNVTAGGDGVVARNEGTAYGGMKEAFRQHSYAGLTYQEGVNVTVDTAGGTVQAGGIGIAAINRGTLGVGGGTTDVTVTTAGETGSTGIYALIGATNNGSGIQYYGSYLRTPTGSSRLIIDTTAGGVVGTAGGGIQAIQTVASGGSVVGVEITTADVTGTNYGIHAVNSGSVFNSRAYSNIDTRLGTVTASAGSGIVIEQSVGTRCSGRSCGSSGVAVRTADVLANGGHGISIGQDEPNYERSPNGTFVDTRLGNVVGDGGDGITVTTSGTASLRIADVAGSRHGVYLAQTDRVKYVSVTTYDDNGETTFVSGNSGHGIQVVSQVYYETEINVTSATYVMRGLSGITASHTGGAYSNFDINIDNGGVVANRSFLSSDLAINADSTGTGVTLDIGATGIVIGTVDLTDADDVFTNDGHWDASGGTSDFGLGDDQFFDTSDLTLVVGNGTAGQMTRFDGLENFTNTGTIDFADGYSSDVFTVSGDFTGDGIMVMDVSLGATGVADMLVVGGDVTGATTIGLVQLDGDGALTGMGQDDGIVLVRVTGGTDAGDFVLGNAIQDGLYLYDTLTLGTDGAWRLQSQFLPTVSAYEALPTTLLAMTDDLGSYRDRRGVRDVSMARDDGASEAWVRLGHSRIARGSEGSVTNSTFEQSFSEITGGMDFHADNGLIGGVNLRYVSGSSDVTSPTGATSLSTTGYGIGATLTWHGATGFYVDAQARAMSFDTDLLGTAGISGMGYAASLEAGRRVDLNTGCSITPQAQLSYARIDFDTITDAFDEAV